MVSCFHEGDSFAGVRGGLMPYLAHSAHRAHQGKCNKVCCAISAQTLEI